MPVFNGTTSGSVLSEQYNIVANITSISLVDKGTGGTAIVAIVENGTQVYIRSVTLAANGTYQDDTKIKLLSGFEVLVIASAALDYYITVE